MSDLTEFRPLLCSSADVDRIDKAKFSGFKMGEDNLILCKFFLAVVNLNKFTNSTYHQYSDVSFCMKSKDKLVIDPVLCKNQRSTRFSTIIN